MRKLMKAIAVVLTLTMLLSAVALTAVADDAVTVTLTGRTQMEKGDSYFADLKVSGSTGGVQGTIEYDTAALEYVGVTYSDAFEAANADLDTVAAVSEENGTIKFVGLNPGADKVWFTLEFTVNTEGEVAVGVGAEDAFVVKASNTDGTGTVTATATGATVVAVAPDQVSMDSASIKATENQDNQDLRLLAIIGDIEATVVEYGVIFLPTHLLKGAELNYDPDYVYGTNSNDKPIKAAIAKAKNPEGLKTDVNLYATLTGSGSYNSRALVQVDITSRAYAVLKDEAGVETVIYSNNDLEDTNINDGYADKSIIGVSKVIANSIKNDKDVKYSGTIEDVTALEAILNKEGKLGGNDVSAILSFLKANETLINQKANTKA